MIKKNVIAILIALFAFAGTASANSFDFKNANTASEKRGKLQAAVQAAFEENVMQKFGDEVARTKGGRIALRVTVLDSNENLRTLKVTSNKRRAVSSGMPTPEKPESFIFLCDISMAGKPLACIEMDAKFEPKRDVQIRVNDVPAKKRVGAQVLRTDNPASESEVMTSNPESVAILRDLAVSLPPAIGDHTVELRTYWFVDANNPDPDNGFYFPSVENITVEPIGVFFWLCRKDGATDAEDKVQFEFGFVPFDGKFPAAPMVTMNDLPLTPAEPSNVGPDPDFPFAKLLTVVISAKNYADVAKSSVEQGGLFISVKGVGDELSFEWFDPFELPPIEELMSCDEEFSD